MINLDFIYKVHDTILQLQDNNVKQYYEKRIQQDWTYCDIAFEVPALLLTPDDNLDSHSLEYVVNRHQWNRIYFLLNDKNLPCFSYCSKTSRQPFCFALQSLCDEYQQHKEEYDKQFRAIFCMYDLC